MRFELFMKKIDLSQKKRSILSAILYLSLPCFAFLAFSSLADEKNESYSIVVLPDTQNYVKYLDADKKFLAQTNWIKANKDKLNIKFVIHEGDLTDDNSPEQWEKVKKCMSIIESVVPFAFCPGNHDIGHKGAQKSPVCEYLNPEKSASPGAQFERMGDENCFSYKFEAGGEKYLVISLDLGPNDKMLEWANSVAEANPERKILMVTHIYLNNEALLTAKESKKSAACYGKHPDGSKRNDGLEIWDKHVKKHKNYLMVFCGHFESPNAMKSSKGDNGNTVHQMMANFQYGKGGGNGFLRILKFVPDEKRCYVSTYSPFLDEYVKDATNEFVLDLGETK